MAQATDSKAAAREFLRELRGSDRVFQIDRDTALVFSGMHPDDVRPFVRIGAGRQIPDAILRQIEYVILPEDDPCNLGLELAWLGATVQSGEKTIRYVGSRERVNQVYSFAGMPEIDEPSERPVQPVIYHAFRAQDLKRDHFTTVFMTNGDAVLQMGSTRIYDHHANRRIRLTIDKEYELLSRALARRKRTLEAEQGEAPRGFYWPGPEYAPSANANQIFWSFGASGVLLNPSADHHQVLFEHAIDPARVDTVLSYSASAPGFAEALRRKNSEQRPGAAFTADQEAFGQLRRAYRNSKLQFVSDGASLPTARDVQLYISRTASHVAFSWRTGGDLDRAVQIVAPLGGKRQSRSFDYIRGPHDLELRLLNDREELKESGASLTLLLPGEGRQALLDRMRLSAAMLPLLPATEYLLYSSESLRGLSEHILSPFHGTEQEEAMRTLLFLHLGLEFSPEALGDGLQQLALQAPAADVVTAINVSQYLRYLRLLPGFGQYSERHKKLLQRAESRFDPARFRSAELLAQRSRLRGRIAIAPGQGAFLILEAIAPPAAELRCPPPVSAIESDRKAYPRLVRQWSKQVNKAGDPAGYAQCIEALEKLYEYRLFLVEERDRLRRTLNGLGIGQELQSSSLPDPVQEQGPGLLERLRSWFSGAGRAAVAILIAAIALAVFTAGFFTVKALAASLDSGAPGTTLRGDSADEQRAVQLAPPGAVESGEPAPGEDQIQAPAQEVLLYANALASRNGFRPINRAGDQRRDPDLVFPGDRLRLPDGRIALVQRGQHLWEIAQKFYRRDMARLLILDRQMSALLQDGLSAEVAASIKQHRKLMQRLAVTPQMKKVLGDREQEVLRRNARP
ncbi:MAG: hypothetical protein K1X75_03465 [Leptospirales bacterium]|nr:hypothetical protein [Leptospirales bacterium]